MRKFLAIFALITLLLAPIQTVTAASSQATLKLVPVTSNTNSYSINIILDIHKKEIASNVISIALSASDNLQFDPKTGANFEGSAYTADVAPVSFNSGTVAFSRMKTGADLVKGTGQQIARLTFTKLNQNPVSLKFVIPDKAVEPRTSVYAGSGVPAATDILTEIINIEENKEIPNTVVPFIKAASSDTPSNPTTSPSPTPDTVTNVPKTEESSTPSNTSVSVISIDQLKISEKSPKPTFPEKLTNQANATVKEVKVANAQQSNSATIKSWGFYIPFTNKAFRIVRYKDSAGVTGAALYSNGSLLKQKTYTKGKSRTFISLVPADSSITALLTSSEAKIYTDQIQ